MHNTQTQPEIVLIGHICDKSSKGLLIIGEGFPLQILDDLTSTNIDICTNRYDLFIGLRERGFNPVLSDLRIIDSYSWIAFRIFKDKAANHYLFNQAADRLKEDGRLIIVGSKQEGIKTYQKNVTKRLGGTATSRISGKGTRIVTVPSLRPSENLLDDKNYAELRANCIPELPRVYSKPGIFGWQKRDQGSTFLLQHCEIPNGASVLDIGCGYGYLSIEAWRRNPSFIHATDNNVAAVSACRYNFTEFQIEGCVTVDDCAASLSERFDVILCNPPFHTGYGSNQNITTRFVESICDHLKPHGMAYVVVNAFIAIEKVLRSYRLRFTEIATDKGFKVLRINLLTG